MNTAVTITAIIAALLLALGIVNAIRDTAKAKHDSADHQRLNYWKRELQDALDMDPTRDWDDIRNAVKGTRSAAQADRQVIEVVLNLPETPDVMDAQHTQPQGYIHGYKVAIGDAKRAARRGVRR